MSEETVFMQGGDAHMQCEMELRDANIVTVEPYAIYTSPKKRRHFMVYQTGRAGAQGDNGWRYYDAGNVRAVKILDRPFTTRKDYDPFNKDILAMVHYSIPALDGRTRQADMAPSWDKSVHNKPAGSR